jgi:hypothetical protein
MSATITEKVHKFENDPIQLSEVCPPSVWTVFSYATLKMDNFIILRTNNTSLIWRLFKWTCSQHCYWVHLVAGSHVAVCMTCEQFTTSCAIKWVCDMVKFWHFRCRTCPNRMLLLIFKEPDIINASPLWNPVRPLCHHQEKTLQHVHKWCYVTQQCPSPCMHTLWDTLHSTCRRILLEHPPYTPYLSLCDFHVLDPFREELKGSRFKSNGDMKTMVVWWLPVSTSTLVNYF